MERALPDWPRGMREDLAAEYVGLKVGTFRNEMKQDGAPRPTYIRRCKVYLKDDLDAWLLRQFDRADVDEFEAAVNES